MNEKLSERMIEVYRGCLFPYAWMDEVAALEQALAAKDAEIARLRSAMQGISRYVDFYMKREVESPSNHQDMAREAEERWATFNATLAETPAAPEVK